MKGNPKFKVDDKVIVTLRDGTIKGTVCIVDANGTFFNDSDVSYDVLGTLDAYISDSNPEGKCMFKHIPERLVKLDNNEG